MAGVVSEVANVGIIEIGDLLRAGCSQGDTIALVSVDRREIACHSYRRYGSDRVEVRSIVQRVERVRGKDDVWEK